MALGNYTELKAEVALWLDREDLTTQIPTFITLFEAQAERKLRTRQMLVLNEAGTTTAASGLIALPENFLALQNLTVYNSSGSPISLTYASKNQCDNRRAQAVTNRFPEVYTIGAVEIELAPYPDAAYSYEMSYWEKIARLSTSVSSNWLLAAHPDLYLYGTLMQAAPYLKHDERIDVWSGAVGVLMEDITLADERAMRAPGSPLKTRMKAYG